MADSRPDPIDGARSTDGNAAEAHAARPLETSLPPPQTVARQPGPGLAESIGWMVGTHLVLNLAAAGVLALLVGVFLLSLGSSAQAFLFTEHASPGLVFVEFFFDHLIVVLGAAQVTMVLYALVLTRLRLRPYGLSRLGLKVPAAGHWMLVALSVLPLTLLCTELQKVMFGLVPGAQNRMADFMEELSRAPLPLLILAIAIGPALGEELIFRGLIGRGLIARWGVVRGVLITSLLFGITHINPAQAIGVIPLGIAMHFAYLTTRSLWAPITLHLLNNALAVSVLKIGDGSPVARFVDDGRMLPLHLLVASAAMVTGIGLLLWQTRVQFALRDGSVWDPGYSTSELPPPDLAALAVRQSPRPLLVACGTFNSLGFVAVLWRLSAAV